MATGKYLQVRLKTNYTHLGLDPVPKGTVGKVLAYQRGGTGNRLVELPGYGWWSINKVHLEIIGRTN